MPKLLLISSIGNIIEFYDFALFGLLAVKISENYFPFNTSFLSYLATFTIFALSFIARPIGSIIFGYVGDKCGGRFSLSYSLLIMSLITFLLGVVPSYEYIGITAPILISILRILQGICMGGEFTVSLIFLSDNFKNNEKNKSLLIAASVASGMSGWLLASLVVYLLHLPIFPDYAWRFAFFISSLGGFVGYYIRKSNDVYFTNTIPPDFFREFKYSLSKNINPFLVVIGIGCYIGILFYGQFVFKNIYLIKIIGVNSSIAYMSTTIGIVIYIIFLPIMGYLADKIGHKLMMKAASILGIVLSYSIFDLLVEPSNFNILLSQTISALILSGFVAPAMYIMTIQFPKEIRYTAVSFCYNISTCLFGGMAPLISMLLIEYTSIIIIPFTYLLLGGLISYFTLHTSQ